MDNKIVLQKFFIGDKEIEIFTPDINAVQEEYKNKQGKIATPYWAQVWPAAIGLCIFLQNNIDYIKDKTVLELAAGVGLPGIFSAAYAKNICISDAEPAAAEIVKRSVAHHHLKNVTCQVIDWNYLEEIFIPEIVLLSDINYDPAQFEKLLSSVYYLLHKGCTLILSTPQRLMAKDFISKLLEFCKEQQEVFVETGTTKTGISIFVLKK